MGNIFTNALGSLISRKRGAELRMQVTGAISSSARLLKKVRKRLKAERKDKRREEKDMELIEESAEYLDLDELVESFDDFINKFLDEENELIQMLKRSDTVEFKIEKQLQKFIEELKDLTEKYEDEVLSELVRSLVKELDDIKKFVIQEKKRAHDLAFGHDNRFRDKSVMPYFMIYHKLRKIAKESRKDINHLERIDKHMEKIITLLRKNKSADLSSSEGNEAKKEISSLKELLTQQRAEVMDEFKELMLLERFLTVLETRSEDRFTELLDTLSAIRRKEGLPKMTYDELLEEARQAHIRLHKWDKKELAATKVIAMNAAA